VGADGPRRALGPVPEDWGDPIEVSPTASAGPLLEPDELTDTGMMRRLALNSDGSLQDLVPPPRPVLPTSETLPASAGRRFSADDQPYESWAAPRRSAASVSSPPSAYEPLLPPMNRPTAPPQVTVPYQSFGVREVEQASAATPMPAPSATRADETVRADRAVSTPSKAQTRAEAKAAAEAAKVAAAEAKADAKAAAAEARADAKAAKADAAAEARAAKDAAKAAKRNKGKAPKPAENNIAARLGAPQTSASAAAAPPKPSQKRSSRSAIIVIAAVVVVALLVAVGVWAVLLRPAASGAASGTQTSSLLTGDDLSTLAAGTWQQGSSPNQAICFADTTEKAQQESSTALTNSDTSMYQLVTTYNSAADAASAYNERLTQAGTCPDNAAVVVSASTATGLAPSAQIVDLTARTKTAENHTLVITQNGQKVNAFDLTTTATIPDSTVANVVAKALSRQCDGSGCPGGIQVVGSVPAAGDPAGWLVPADLPLSSTTETTKWSVTDYPATHTGTQCENMDLSAVTGTVASGKRSLTMAEDKFGVDQITYTFADTAAANKLATTLITNMSTCTTRSQVAKSDAGPKLSELGANSVPITGQTWQVTATVGNTATRYRVGVVLAGTRVTYVFANPTTKFDFTDAQWQSVVKRAGQRSTQAA
jgi:hypothetical protein